ncbi:MAG: FecR domain-containing protein [Pseudomonadota bacterium]
MIPGKDGSRPNFSPIEEKALELVSKHARSPNAHSQAEIETFRRQSEEHDSAIRSAERFNALSRRVKTTTPGFFQSAALRMELILVRTLGKPLVLGTSVAAALLLAWILPQLDAPSIVEHAALASPPTKVEQYRTRNRQQDTIVLTDGSTVWLGWRTEIEVAFSSTHRRVTLRRGVAAFDVISDALRPFIVSADGTQTRVTGTEFIVDARRGNQVEVSVLEGQVEVRSPEDQLATLGPTDTVQVVGEKLMPIAMRSIEEMGQWRDGMLIFNDHPIVDAIEDLEPFTRFRIDTTAISGHGGLVSGVFFIDQADEALFTVLESHRLRAKDSGRNTLILQDVRKQPK